MSSIYNTGHKVLVSPYPYNSFPTFISNFNVVPVVYLLKNFIIDPLSDTSDLSEITNPPILPLFEFMVPVISASVAFNFPVLVTVNGAVVRSPPANSPAHIRTSPLLFTFPFRFDVSPIFLPDVMPATILLSSVITTSLLDNSSIYALLDIS
nr:MAG TPA: hypothetical protein [Caudoviricetes sp.]